MRAIIKKVDAYIVSAEFENIFDLREVLEIITEQYQGYYWQLLHIEGIWIKLIICVTESVLKEIFDNTYSLKYKKCEAWAFDTCAEDAEEAKSIYQEECNRIVFLSWQQGGIDI